MCISEFVMKFFKREHFVTYEGFSENFALHPPFRMHPWDWIKRPLLMLKLWSVNLPPIFGKLLFLTIRFFVCVKSLILSTVFTVQEIAAIFVKTKFKFLLPFFKNTKNYFYFLHAYIKLPAEIVFYGNFFDFCHIAAIIQYF